VRTATSHIGAVCGPGHAFSLPPPPPPPRRTPPLPLRPPAAPGTAQPIGPPADAAVRSVCGPATRQRVAAFRLPFASFQVEQRVHRFFLTAS
jgi:hypothetical protein